MHLVINAPKGTKVNQEPNGSITLCLPKKKKKAKKLTPNNVGNTAGQNGSIGNPSSGGAASLTGPGNQQGPAVNTGSGGAVNQQGSTGKPNSAGTGKQKISNGKPNQQGPAVPPTPTTITNQPPAATSTMTDAAKMKLTIKIGIEEYFSPSPAQIKELIKLPDSDFTNNDGAGVRAKIQEWKKNP